MAGLAGQSEVLMPGNAIHRALETMTRGGTVSGAEKIVGGKPTSFAATLDGLANWMDRVDKILVRRGEVGKPSTGKVQADLRRAARALRLDPMLDDLMMDAMLNGPETDLPDETELF